MICVSFTSLSKLDRIYTRKSKGMKKILGMLYKPNVEEEEKIKDALCYYKECVRSLPYPGFFSKGLYSRYWFIKVVIIVFELFRFIYKCIYFYLFPYLIIPISYGVYDIFEIEHLRYKFVRESIKREALIDPGLMMFEENNMKYAVQQQP